MKNRLFALLAAMTIAGTGASAAQPGNAQSSNSLEFYCDTRGEAPVTKVAIPQSSPEEHLPLIVWEATFFEGFLPLLRCQDVSARFQTFWRNGTLNYITTDTMNDMPVICISPGVGYNCTGLLLTLRPNIDDPQEVLRHLLEIGDLGRGPLVGNSSYVYDIDGKLYIDVQIYLDNKRRELLD